MKVLCAPVVSERWTARVPTSVMVPDPPPFKLLIVVTTVSWKLVVSVPGVRVDDWVVCTKLMVWLPASVPDGEPEVNEGVVV